MGPGYALKSATAYLFVFLFSFADFSTIRDKSSQTRCWTVQKTSDFSTWGFCEIDLILEVVSYYIYITKFRGSGPWIPLISATAYTFVFLFSFADLSTSVVKIAVVLCRLPLTSELAVSEGNDLSLCSQ